MPQRSSLARRSASTATIVGCALANRRLRAETRPGVDGRLQDCSEGGRRGLCCGRSRPARRRRATTSSRVRGRAKKARPGRVRGGDGAQDDLEPRAAAAALRERESLLGALETSGNDCVGKGRRRRGLPPNSAASKRGIGTRSPHGDRVTTSPRSGDSCCRRRRTATSGPGDPAGPRGELRRVSIATASKTRRGV